jgi:hypothetical protein
MRDLKIDEVEQVYGAGGWGRPSKSCHSRGSTHKKSSHKKSSHKRSSHKRSSKKCRSTGRHRHS